MSNKHFFAIVAGAIILSGFLAYANTFAGDWVWDDVSSVLLHEHVQDPGKLFQLFREDQHAFGRGQGNFYRPLVSVSFMLDFALSHDEVLDSSEAKGYPDVKPFVFHLTNILWHIAAAILLFALLVRLEAPRAIQAIAPILFVLHPMHTEAVAYISGRADMMSAVFILAALLCATAEAKGKRRAIMLGLSGLFFVLGLCSKESSTIYPLLLLLLIALRPTADGALPGRAEWKARSTPLALAAAILAGYGALRMTMLKFSEGGESAGSGLGQRLLETCQAFALYIKTLFLPTGLHMEQTLAGVPAWTAAIGLLLLIACAAAIAWSARAGHYRIALGFSWFLAAWFPISGVFPLNAPMAEHWMYVPMAGFWWALLELVLHVSKNLPIRPLAPAAAILALVFLFQTVARNRDWQTNESIFRATLAENPNTLRVHSNLAVTYEYLDINLPGARRHYEAVLDAYDAQRGSGSAGLMPDEIPVRLSLGGILLRQQAYNEAYTIYGSLLPLGQQEQFRADAARAAFGAGQCLLGLGDFAGANQAMQQALAWDPALAPRYRAIMRGAPLPDIRLR